MSNFDAWTTLAVIIGGCIVIVISGFFVNMVGTPNYAMPDLTTNISSHYQVPTGCPRICDFNPSYPSCGDNPVCREDSCLIRWYWICIVGDT